MFINGINIKEYNAKLISKEIQTAEVTIFDDWLDFSLNPLYFGKTEKFKKIEIKLLVQEKTDEKALMNISNLIKEMSKCTLKFRDLSSCYDCTIVDKEHRRIIKGEYEIDVELKSSFAYTTEEVVTLTDRTTNIHVSGNMKTPVIIEITPTLNLIDFFIKGLGEDILIKNLTKDKKIIIDGEKGEVTESGINKYKDYDSWGFPYLNPGDNNVSINKDNVNVKIRYKPRWI